MLFIFYLKPKTHSYSCLKPSTLILKPISILALNIKPSTLNPLRLTAYDLYQ